MYVNRSNCKEACVTSLPQLKSFVAKDAVRKRHCVLHSLLMSCFNEILSSYFIRSRFKSVANQLGFQLTQFPPPSSVVFSNMLIRTRAVCAEFVSATQERRFFNSIANFSINQN